MDILTTTIIKTAEEKTLNAAYSLEFTTTNNQISKVQASVYTLPTGEHAEKQHLGYIIFENENINCSLSGSAPLTKIITDFEFFMDLIKSEYVATTTTTQQTDKQ